MATGSMSKGPGKSYREGLSLDRLFRMFPTDEAAEAWFTAERWPDGPYCPHCGSRNIQCGIAHPTMTHRCRDCPKRRMFSLKTGTVMQGSPLGYRTWLAAIYLVATNLKGVSSMKLHRDLGIGQKSAWYLAHRIREAWKEVGDPFAGPQGAPQQAPLDQPDRAAACRDQAPHQRRRHLPKRGRHHPTGRRRAARAERRVGRLKEIHDAGIHRPRERQSHRQAAHRGCLSVPGPIRRLPRPTPGSYTTRRDTIVAAYMLDEDQLD